MTNSEIIQMLTGPFSAMVLAVIMLFAMGKWLAQNVPLYLDRHLRQIDKMIESHNQDREMYRQGLQTLTEQHNVLAREVQEITVSVKDIRDEVTTLNHRVS
jgi:septal ring factor EnvC (AmiA/AmiB activator)